MQTDDPAAPLRFSVSLQRSRNTFRLFFNIYSKRSCSGTWMDTPQPSHPRNVMHISIASLDFCFPGAQNNIACSILFHVQTVPCLDRAGVTSDACAGEKADDQVNNAVINTYIRERE